MSPRRVERFATMEEEVAIVTVSPTLANMLATPVLVDQTPVQVDTLARDKAMLGPAGEQRMLGPTGEQRMLGPAGEQRMLGPAGEQRMYNQHTPSCPKCEKCPDMTQYVRLDEVPCWNCTLP
jgi:hypothetical protein